MVGNSATNDMSKMVAPSPKSEVQSFILDSKLVCKVREYDEDCNRYSFLGVSAAITGEFINVIVITATSRTIQVEDVVGEAHGFFFREEDPTIIIVKDTFKSKSYNNDDNGSSLSPIEILLTG